MLTPQAPQMFVDAALYLVQMQPGGAQIVSGHGKGAELHPGVVIAAHCVHGFQKLLCLFRDPVKILVMGQRRKVITRFHSAVLQVDEAELEMHGRIEEIEEIAPFIQHGQLFIVVRKLVVDVVILDGLGKVGIVHLADAVRVHFPVRNSFLSGAGAVAQLPQLCHRCVQAFSFGPRQFHFLFFTPFGARLFFFSEQIPEQWLSPPCRIPPVCAWRHRDC